MITRWPSRPPVRTALAAAAALGLLGACSSDDPEVSPVTGGESSVVAESVESGDAGGAAPGSTVRPATPVEAGSTTTTSASGSTPTAPAPTAPAPSATATTAGPSPSATPAPSTAPPPVPGSLDLRADGIGPVAFGQPADSVLATFVALFGPPTHDATSEFPIPSGVRLFVDADRNVFAAPVGRFACFERQLCLAFGGDRADALTWIGWSLRSDAGPGPALATASGVRIGATWASVATAISVEPNGCFHTGYGLTDGISLALLSPDAWFGDMGSPEPAATTTPDPSAVVITEMWAGAQSSSLDADC